MTTKRLYSAFLLLFATWFASGLLRTDVTVSANFQSTLKIVKLRTEYKENPVGIDTRGPRFSWQIQSGRRGVMQSAYQIIVTQAAAEMRNLPVWDTGKVNSDQSNQLAYRGPQLQSTQRYYWRVKVWDATGNASDW